MIFKNPFPAFLFLGFFSIRCGAPRAIPSQSAPSLEERLEKIKMTDLEGRPMRLKDFSGTAVFLNFWASWCGPCASEMTSIEKASRQFGDSIVFLALSNESPEQIEAFRKKNRLTFRFARLEATYLDVYVVTLPTTLLINAKGEVVAEEEGFQDWASPGNIEKLESLRASP